MQQQILPNQRDVLAANYTVVENSDVVLNISDVSKHEQIVNQNCTAPKGYLEVVTPGRVNSSESRLIGLR